MEPTKQHPWERVSDSQIENARQVTESLIFQRRHPEYIPNSRNAETMAREILKRKLEWNAENLSSVFKSLDKELWDTTEDRRPEAKEPIAPVVEVSEPEKFPWGVALEGPEGAARVQAMERPEYSRYLTDRKWGKIFQKQVNALRLTKSQSKERAI